MIAHCTLGFGPLQPLLGLLCSCCVCVSTTRRTLSERNAYFYFHSPYQDAHLLKANYLWVSSNRPLSRNHFNEFHGLSTLASERAAVIVECRRHRHRLRWQNGKYKTETAREETGWTMKMKKTRIETRISKRKEWLLWSQSDCKKRKLLR